MQLKCKMLITVSKMSDQMKWSIQNIARKQRIKTIIINCRLTWRLWLQAAICHIVRSLPLKMIFNFLSVVSSNWVVCLTKCKRSKSGRIEMQFVARHLNKLDVNKSVQSYARAPFASIRVALSWMQHPKL